MAIFQRLPWHNKTRSTAIDLGPNATPEMRLAAEALRIASLKQKNGLDSAIVVAIIGVVGTMTTLAAGKSSQAVQRRVTLTDRKFEIMTSFSHFFESDMMVLKAYKVDDLWLKAHPDPASIDSLGRPRFAVLHERQEYYKDYLELKKPNSLIDQIRALYTTPEVAVALNEVEYNTNLLIDAQKDLSVYYILGKISDRAGDLSRAMGAELKKEEADQDAKQAGFWPFGR